MNEKYGLKIKKNKKNKNLRIKKCEKIFQRLKIKL
jgi:hypothetical protein